LNHDEEVSRKLRMTVSKEILTANRETQVSGTERKTWVVMALVFAPWAGTVLLTAGVWGAVNFLGYAAVVLGAGYGIVNLTTHSGARSQMLYLAPAAGIMTISALTALWVRLGLPLAWSSVFWLGLAIPGLMLLWRDRANLARERLSYGLTLALLSAAICIVYFVPSASNDLVQRNDGSYSWMFIDTQHFHAVAASIKDGGSPPKTPGTATAELLYHFGAYSPAALISRVDGLPLGDALARVTRGASLWALVLSAFGLGTLLSLRANDTKFGGIMSVAGLFFYGSLLSLFNEETTTLGHFARALVFSIPKVDVPADGGPFDQLLDGHSVLHGMIAITTIMALCLAWNKNESVKGKWNLALLALPALSTPINLEASLYCLGIAGTLIFWGRLSALRSWASIITMVCLFFAGWSVMGYNHSPDAGLVTFNRNLAGQWWPIAVWLIVGLGFRLIAFRWISVPFRDPVSVLVLISVIGWLSFCLLFRLRDDNQRYGIYFLQSVLSIFAFSRVAPNCWHSVERSKLITDWLRIANRTMIVLLICAITIRVGIFLMHSQTWMASMRLQILPFFLVLMLIIAASVIMKQESRFSVAVSAGIMGVLLIGFLGWLPTWIRFALQTVPTSVTYSPDEVRGLHRLGQLMAANDLFATNKHNIDRLDPLPPLALSYGYSALAEHPVLLEGFLARGEQALPRFKDLLHDNELLFGTTDPNTLREIAAVRHIRWLVARPGTDIALPRPLPAWLSEVQDTGNLKIYRLD
jgi:hypothetical protein